MRPIHHALVLNLHQPSGNLTELLQSDAWSAREILYALDRIARSLWPYEEHGRVHLSLSGTLLETLKDPDFQRRTYGIVRAGDMLWHWQNERIIRVLGTAYYHPVLPLVPPEDWHDQLGRWLGVGGHLFGPRRFTGFWPPEMAFCMQLIPLLRQLGYSYVLVDSEHVRPLTPMSWEQIRYRPHVARYGDDEIVVIVRDREFSDAQESGMEPSWFVREAHARTHCCDFPPLVTTCSDGDNGGWFRNTSAGGNFWGAFYQPLLERVRRREADILPTFIDDYLARYGTEGLVEVQTGAWNTGWHHGCDFTQWTGSEAQRNALRRVAELSRAWHAAARRPIDNERRRELEQAHWKLLRAETSCHFFWGEAWVPRCHADLDEVEARLARLDA